MKKTEQLKSLTEQELTLAVGGEGEATPFFGGFKPGGPLSPQPVSPTPFVRTYGPILND
jgi:hypothetical protein